MAVQGKSQMRRNVISADVFIATPGYRSSYFFAAIEAIRNVNATASDDCPVIFNSSHWTDLRDKVIQTKERLQNSINQLIDRSDFALIIDPDRGDLTRENGLTFTQQEFLDIYLKTIQQKELQDRLLLAFDEIPEEVSPKAGSQRLNYENFVHYRSFANTKELIAHIEDFLKSRRSEILESELFITMPIQKKYNDSQSEHLIDETSELLELYANEDPITFFGNRHPYVFLDEELIDICALKNALSSCAVVSDEFHVSSPSDSIRYRLFQAQFLLVFAHWEKLTSNGEILRFSGSAKDGFAIQKTMYYEQVISNLALFWPRNSKKWVGKSGLLQDFKFADGNLSTRAALGSPTQTLYKMIADRESTIEELPPLETRYLANTLGVAALVLLTNQDGAEFVLAKKRDKKKSVFNGIHTIVSFPLKWPKTASNAKKFDLWDFIEKSAGSRTKEYLLQNGTKLNEVSIKIKTTPLILGREMMRGGKPQLFLLTELDISCPNEVARILKTCTVKNHDTVSKIINSRKVTEEFRFLGAAYQSLIISRALPLVDE